MKTVLGDQMIETADHLNLVPPSTASESTLNSSSVQREILSRTSIASDGGLQRSVTSCSARGSVGDCERSDPEAVIPFRPSKGMNRVLGCTVAIRAARLWIRRHASSSGDVASWYNGTFGVYNFRWHSSSRARRIEELSRHHNI